MHAALRNRDVLTGQRQVGVIDRIFTVRISRRALAPVPAFPQQKTGASAQRIIKPGDVQLT